MDLNTATFEEMQSLAGIGHGRAQAIFDGRASLNRPLTLLDLLEMGIPADVVKALVDDLEIKAIPRHEEKDEGIDVQQMVVAALASLQRISYVEAVVEHVSVLSRKFYDNLSCRPKPVESIRLKGASASGVMVGCRVDGVEVDLGDGHGNYSMTMYVANITDNCILGLDYLKARKAVIDLSRGV